MDLLIIQYSKQLKGERNYHIFYRLLAGMSTTELAKLQLVKDPRKYDYLTKVCACTRYL